MKKILALLCMSIISCGSPDHNKERKDVCDHIEGFSGDSCNASDDFSPYTCETAMAQFEAWWRSDAQTTVNNCLSSSACYSAVNSDPGPSITVPLQLCLGTELTSLLKPTGSETDAATRYCTKSNGCGQLVGYTTADCESILLSPYDNGSLFLMMNDDVAKGVADCDNSSCADFPGCVTNILTTAGALDNVMTVSVTMPKLMRVENE